MAEDKPIINKAVALKYNHEIADAPRITASGKGVLAEKIIETARDAGIHIKEDPDLLELLGNIPVGQEIPVDLYQTVAELLAFVYQVNDNYKKRDSLG